MTRNNIKITIITPTYNAAKTLSRTIDSVIDQKYPNLEYIIIDGSSNDGTLEIIQKYQREIEITLVSEPDKGLYDAMNKGVEMATGDVIGILNSDDFYFEDSVLKMVSEVFSKQKVDAVYGDLKYFSNDVNNVTRYWKAGEYSEAKLQNGWTIPHPTLFVHKSVYEKYGLFDTSFSLAADYEFTLRILKKHKIKTQYIPKTFTMMYCGGRSGRNLKQRIMGWRELKKSWKINKLQTPFLFILRRTLYKISQFLFKT